MNHIRIGYAVEACFIVAEFCLAKLATVAAWMIAPVFAAWIGCRGARLHLAALVAGVIVTAGVAVSQNFAAEIKRLDRLEAVVERQSDNITQIQLSVAERKYLEAANTARLTSLEVQTADVQRSVSEVRGGITALQWLGAAAALILGFLIKGHEITRIFKRA